MEEKKLLVETKLKEILTNYVEIDESHIDNNMLLVNDIGLDSFSLICMVGEIENQFNIKIETNTLSSVHTIGEMVNFIAEQTK